MGIEIVSELPNIPLNKINELKIREKWHQNHCYCFFTLYIKNLKNDDIKIYLKNAEVIIDIKNTEEKIFRRRIHFYLPITKTEWKLTPFKVSLIFTKSNPGHWEFYENGDFNNCIKVKKKSNSKIEFKEPIEEDNREDPHGGLMKMMKKLYDDGDDNMKRIIAKSWTESQKKNR